MSTQEKPPQYDQTCSLCGTPVRVVGNTTMNYESAYESLRAENKRLISASEELRRENQRLHLQWSAAMNARDEARAALETWETRWRNCNDRAKEERDALKAQLAKSIEFRAREREAFEAQLSAHKEIDALKSENERLKRERHDVKCPHCLQSFWFTAWDGEYPHNLSIPCSHLKERDELKARLAGAERLLDTIKDAPIWEVQEERNRLKALCGDMLAEWNAGRVYAPSDKLKIYERLQNYVEET